MLIFTWYCNLSIGDNVDLQQWQCGEEVKPQSLQDEQVLGVGKKEATPLSCLHTVQYTAWNFLEYSATVNFFPVIEFK